MTIRHRPKTPESPAPLSDVLLRLPDATELLRFDAEGRAFVRGEEVTNLVAVQRAVTEWLEAAFRETAGPVLVGALDVTDGRNVFDVRTQAARLVRNRFAIV